MPGETVRLWGWLALSKKDRIHPGGTFCRFRRSCVGQEEERVTGTGAMQRMLDRKLGVSNVGVWELEHITTKLKKRSMLSSVSNVLRLQLSFFRVNQDRGY